MRHATAGLRHGKLAAKLAPQTDNLYSIAQTVAHLLIQRLTFYFPLHYLLFFAQVVGFEVVDFELTQEW